MKKKDSKKSKIEDTKQQKEQEEIHAEWVEKTRAKAASMLEEVFEEIEQREAKRVEILGRWAPVAEALEHVVEATFGVAEDAMIASPRRRLSVSKTRDAVLARLRGDEGPTASLTDAAFAVGLLADLLDEDFGLGLSAFPEALIATLNARTVGDALSKACSRL